MRKLLIPLILIAACSKPPPISSTASRLTTGPSKFTLFESGQVRPLAKSPNGKLLFATNTPDNRLEVYRIQPDGLVHQASLSVGMEPVAVAARTNDEVWVVNHLSDSISIVRLRDGGRTGTVVRTLLVGDEPRDIVFAGSGRNSAFITTAHRGQNVPYDPQPTTPGIGRADVWVFDANHLGTSLTGTPTTILSLFTDTPRALATSPDGMQVYAAGFHSGNQTTTISALLTIFRGTPPPLTNFQGIAAPATGLVVKFDGAHWRDSSGGIWDDAVELSLPDKDVFTIDASANPPLLRPNAYTGVGTILFNMAVNPVNGHLYVSNLESFNQVRFEGPGIFGHSTVRGHNVESRVTVIANGTVAPRHLNKHINYSQCCAQLPNDENSRSLAFPQSMAISSDGSTMYVSALGSSKVGIFNTTQLENDTFVPNAANQIEVSGGGPTGLVLDDQNRRLYVLTRFDNSISVIDTSAKTEIAHMGMYNPEPSSITQGRRFLYDARFTSSHGDQACAGCHIFGDFDSLAWDLGNPDNPTKPNQNPFIGQVALPKVFHPMKGIMTTQSLRGMRNSGPMHWRGDRTGSDTEPNIRPNSGAFDATAGFKEFNPAFQSLVGRADQLADDQMQAFSDFILQVTYPPNPLRHLNNSLTASQQAGSDFFHGPPSFQGNLACADCHVEDPINGFFGTSGLSSFPDEPDLFKVPHLRNLYQKVGKFGMAQAPFGLVNPGDNDFKGDQVRGIGFNHDGSFDTVFRFNNVLSFDQRPDNPGGLPIDDTTTRHELEDYMLAFESDLAPIVGQQVTISSDSGSDSFARLALLISRAEMSECDLIAKARVGDSPELGFLYTGNGSFQPNQRALASVSYSNVATLSAATPVTFTCVPPGSGRRLAIDRDDDGRLDGDN
jgi:DNA-binding beta-propeller fold protein YncE